MKTLISSSPLHFSNFHPWKPKTATTLRPTASQSLNQSRKSTTRTPNASAKGFGSTARPVPTVKEAPASKNSDSGKDNDDEIPQVVFERMIGRIAVSVGVPMAAGLGLLKFFGVVKEQHLWDMPMWLPLLTAFFMFAVSALGLAYGALSTSWDAEKKGSLLGLEQVQENWVDMWREEDENNKM